ncbi:P-loop containing nucleoside triphosphate hydrolase protein [Bimuria novae-zelandiae CBS 107.79]|uniref:P-loop containing nucleoside triphosphate hydrolase protein n=1 Tax=Bimuria novae-zelandiae CBS 107.79 TaxID=1447943 RepID=A0A6A5VJK8_9PLEO|nr:P-loop containing nucleoside triphosphate hydrolase protein [Bimuria novae-zelandiae CBS 107.79]
MIYHASVYGVHRAEETVYLKVDGLQELILPKVSPPKPMPIFVNVVFPLQKRVIHACRDALVFVNDALDQALEKERQLLRQSGSVSQHQRLAKDMAEYVINDEKATNRNTQLNESDSDHLHNDWIRRMLFPVDTDGKVQTQLRKVTQRALFDSEVNYEQAHAVNSICINDYGCLPYLISGPPGTGKTKTIVETAMQLLNSHVTDHILICAPSESAADTLALRLKEYLSKTQLLRLNGPWRADNEVPAALMQHTYMENDMFTLPPFKQFMAFNVVVTSCRDAAILVEARLTNTDLWFLEKNMLEAFHPENLPALPKLHWGALLLDEAAQGTELDVLSAISAVTPAPEYPTSMPQPRFVMAGDEKQLGPKTASRDPQFSMSLFARLFERPIYKNHPLSRTNTKPSTGPPVLRRTMLPILYPPFTNLIRNYRSHPAILSVPSSLFYNDTLLPEAPTHSTPLQHSSLWQGKKWPVLFIPHPFVEDIERDGGGWYNAYEARLACDIAKHLITHDEVIPSTIAIISPFAAQVKRIRSLLRSHEYSFWDVNVGPLEAFQGLEKRVVIIATTRTRGKHFVEDDVKRGLGLIHQQRKMNVALTRAKEALIVLGSAEAMDEEEFEPEEEEGGDEMDIEHDNGAEGEAVGNWSFSLPFKTR